VHPLASIVLAAVLATGPNGATVTHALKRPELRRTLPVDVLAADARRLFVVYHELPDAPMAFYLPPQRLAAAGDARGAPDLGLILLSKTGGVERLLPALEVPRIFLYAPYYRRGTGLTAIREMTLDVAEYLFHTLLEAYLDAVAPAYEPTFSDRAAATLGDVPEEHRRRAYLAALADFGSHLLSLALELERAVERQHTAGKDVCRAVRHPGTLFAKWPRLFREEPFRGHYESGGREVLATGSIGRRDKEILVRDVLGGRWTGDVRQDFGLDCPR